jgi:putative membrane protein
VAPSPWSVDPAWDGAVLVAASVVAYALAARRYPPSNWRIASFAAAQVLLVGLYLTPLDTLALNYHLWAHLLQNVAAAEWAPLLLVLGLSPAMAAALARTRPLRALTSPWIALPLWLAVYYVWHVAPLFEGAVDHAVLLGLEHASYFVAGALLWWAVVHDEPWRLPAGARAAYLFAAFVLASPVGLLLAFAPSPLYDLYEEAPRLWGVSPLLDQQIAGVVMAVSEAVVFFSVFAVWFVRFMAEEDAGYSQPRA